MACAENGFDVLHFDPHCFQCSRFQTPGPKRHVGHGYPGPLPVKRFHLETRANDSNCWKIQSASNHIFNLKCSDELSSCFCHHYTGCEIIITVKKTYGNWKLIPTTQWEIYLWNDTHHLLKWIAVYHFDKNNIHEKP